LNKLIIEIKPNQYKLEKPIYKFDNMLFNEGLVLSEKELNMFKNWGFINIDVIEIIEDKKIIKKENSTKINVSQIKKIKELDTFYFEIKRVLKHFNFQK
jgi:hypothetical protein